MVLEVICDRVHLSAEMVALVFKVKPIEAIALVSDATCGTGLSDGEYELGGLAVRVEKGQTRLVSSGALAGSTLRLNRALQNAHAITGLPLKELVKTTSWNQARSLGLEKQGKLEPGFRADAVILDEEFKVKAVFMDGEQRI
jgi:N-acetylglucosamine-6-phosphate deacetylase